MVTVVACFLQATSPSSRGTTEKSSLLISLSSDPPPALRGHPQLQLPGVRSMFYCPRRWNWDLKSGPAWPLNQPLLILGK